MAFTVMENLFGICIVKAVIKDFLMTNIRKHLSYAEIFNKKNKH